MSILRHSSHCELFEHHMISLFMLVPSYLPFVLLPDDQLRCDMRRHTVGAKVGEWQLIHELILFFVEARNLLSNAWCLISFTFYICYHCQPILENRYFILISLQFFQQCIAICKCIATINTFGSSLVFQYVFEACLHIFDHFQK